MAPVLSPKKTWEGLAGGLALSALVAVAINRLAAAPPVRGGAPLAAAFGVAVGAAGVLGDLAESFLKRDCRLKDASHVVPGFGGVLDVIDSILFAAPVAFAWLSWPF
jgi:phosphatidate cytidylyltransferase